MATTSQVRYAAFLSYSRAADSKLAPALQTALQRFARPWYRPWAIRVFRDDAGLSANPSLWSSITAALDGSEYFILLASPESAQSPWVAREVDYWIAHRGTDTMMIALTDGDIVWSAGDFDRDRTTSVPVTLFGKFDDEPRWVDLRGVRTEVQLSPSAPQFRDKVADLAAPLHHLAKDDLVGVEIRSHRRTRRLVRVVIATLVTLAVAAIGSAVVAVNKANVATAQRRLADERLLVSNQRQLITRADALLSEGDVRGAAMLAAAADAVRHDRQSQGMLSRILAATRMVSSLAGHSATVNAVRLSADGQRLATGSDDGTVVLWDVAERVRPKPIATLDVGAGVESVAFSPSGRLLLAGGKDQRIHVWDAASQAALATVDAGLDRDPVSWLEFVDEQTLISTTWGGDLMVWDLTDPRAARRQHEAQVGRVVARSPDGRWLASATTNFDAAPPVSTLRMWELTKGGELRLSATAAPLREVFSLAFSADGARLAAASQDGSVHLFDVSAPTRPRPIGAAITVTDRSTLTLGTQRSLAFTPADHLLVTGYGRATTEWDVVDPGHPVQVGRPLVGHADAVAALDVAVDGSVLVTGGWDKTTILWDLTDRAAAVRAGEPFHAGDGGTQAAVFSPDSHRLATTARDGAVTLWDVAQPEHPVLLSTPRPAGSAATWSIAFSPDGRTLAGADEALGGVRLWDVAEPRSPQRQAVTVPGGRSVVFSPNGTVLAAAGDGSVSLWPVDAPAGPALATLRIGGTIGTIAFSADGAILAVAADQDHRVQLWNVRDPRSPRSLGAVPDVLINDFALAPDGQTLAVPGAQDDVVLWDASTPKQPTKLGSRLVGNTDAVWTVAFSPDGRTLATGSRDSRILLYDLTDRTHPVPLGTAMTWPDAGGILSVGFAPDATRLAAAGFDGNVVLWDLRSMNALRDNALANACALAGRGLTAQEWSTYTVGVPYRSTC